MDMDSKAVFYELRALAARAVVREWHFGPLCLTFGVSGGPGCARFCIPRASGPWKASPRSTVDLRGAQPYSAR